MKFIFIIFLSLLLFVGSCSSYEAVSIPNLHPEFSPHSQEQKNVYVMVKVFTEDDCRHYFDKNVIDEGYQPIQIAIDNQSECYYLYSPHGISLPTVPTVEVAQKCHKFTLGCSAGCGVTALILWPLAIPATVVGLKSSKANTQMDIDFAAKELKDKVIQPYTNITGIIFVPNSEMQSDITINIIERETRENLSFTFQNIK